MNDFTKEELEEIYYRLENAPQELEDKIQSMIENYCEHEYIESINHCIDCGVSEYRCNKCSHVYYEGLE